MENKISASADFTFTKLAQGKPDDLDLNNPRQRVQAREWFRATAQAVTNLDAVRFMNRAKAERRVSMLTQMQVGKMVMFWYDAKLKKELPYWDRLPLIFPLEIYADGFLGINLHYLPLIYRARLMDALYSTMNNNRMDQTTRLRISYGILKNASRFRFFKPCVKRYLNSHVRSQFVVINPNEWDMALMLPTERFMKERKQMVHMESIGTIMRNGGFDD
jgi:hypothetical protein